MPSRRLISIYNESAQVTDNQVAAMVSALGKQLAEHVAPVWGLVPSLEIVAYGSKGHGIPFRITDVADIPDALGYHDIDDNGVPFIKVFTQPIIESGGQTLIGANSLASVCSHEVLEFVGDPLANVWASQGSHDYAYELCDAVQGDWYAIDGVSVSNFVYPSFFNPRAQSDEILDYMNLCTKPFETRPGGYQIKRVTKETVTLAPSDKLVMHARNNHKITVEFGAGFRETHKSAKLAALQRRLR